MRMLLNMVVKELIQLRRDPKTLAVLFIAPIIQLTLLSYAATTDVRQVELVVCDLDHTPTSRQLLRNFEASTYFRRVATVSSADRVDLWLAGGRARIGITVPAGFEAERIGGRTGTVQVVADGSDPMVGILGLAYAQGVLQTTAQAEGLSTPLEFRPTVLFNPDLVSRYFMVPGVLALLLLVMTMILSSMAIVRETEIGTMEQLLVTPLTPGAVIAGKLVPYALVGVVEFLSALMVVLFWFHVPLRGSFWTLALLTAPFIVCCLGLGLLVSTLSRTQQQAMMIAAFVFMMPQIYLSGFVFPIQNMPLVFQWFTFTVPLRYYVTILRGVFLKGAGVGVLWPHGLALTGLAILILIIARLRYRVRLD